MKVGNLREGEALIVAKAVSPPRAVSPPGHAGKPHFFESVAFFDGAMDATVLFARGCADRVRGGRKAACVAGLFLD